MTVQDTAPAPQQENPEAEESQQQPPQQEASQTPDSDDLQQQEGESDVDWQKRYNDSLREYNTKLKPRLDQATFIAQQAGFDSVEDLYEAIRNQQVSQEETPEADKVDPSKKSDNNDKGKKEKPNAAVPDDVMKKIEALESDKKERQKKEIDSEFNTFYSNFPDAKGQESEVTSLAQGLWRTKQGNKYKYDKLSDALKDAWIIINKESFVEKAKLESLANSRMNDAAKESVLGGSSSSREGAPGKTVTLTADQRRVAAQFIRKGVFKDEAEYAKFIPK